MRERAPVIKTAYAELKGARLEFGKQTTLRLFFNQIAFGCRPNGGATAFLCSKTERLRKPGGLYVRK